MIDLSLMQKKIDDVGTGVRYIGWSRPGKADSAYGWIIQRETTTGSDVVTEFARGPNGNPCNTENFAWSDRLTLTYATTEDASAGTITTATMASNNSTTTLAKVGDVATLTIVGSEYMRTPVVTIGGRAATVTMGGDAKSWTAAITLGAGDTEGLLPFTITAKEIGGRSLDVVSTLTSGSGVTFDKTLPTILTAARVTNTTVKVTLSELAKTASITKSNTGGFTAFKTGTPATTYTVSAIAPGADNTEVILTLASIAGASATGVTIVYTAGGNGTIADLAGNLLATNAGVETPTF